MTNGNIYDKFPTNKSHSLNNYYNISIILQSSLFLESRNGWSHKKSLLSFKNARRSIFF